VGASAFESCASLPGLSLPPGVVSIGDLAFAGCLNLASFTIPAGVTNIGNSEFQGDVALTNVSSPASVTSIGTQAFSQCSGLPSLILPPGVTNIGSHAFDSCIGLTNLAIPASVAAIGAAAFTSSSVAGVFFLGNAPAAGDFLFAADGNNPTAYYLPGTTGWSNTYAADPAVPALAWNPVLQAGGTNHSVQAGTFRFLITGTPTIPIVVQASTNLARGPWVPLQSLTITNGSVWFGDPQWASYRTRFYRVSSPP
jgi:hypothetical protein